MQTLTLRSLAARVPAIEAHLPILASAAVAFAGQMAFARAVLAWPFLGQVLYAAALELFGYGMARLSARVRRDGHRAAAAITAAVIFATYAGACNYWHASPSWAPTPTAVSLGVASVAGLAAFYVHEHYAVKAARRRGMSSTAATVADEPAPVDVPVLATVPHIDEPSPETGAPSGDSDAPGSQDDALSTLRRRSDGPTGADLAREYLAEQHTAGRLHEVTGPEVAEQSGIKPSFARTVLRDFRKARGEQSGTVAA